MIDDLYQLMSGDDPRAAAASMAAALRGNRQLAGINAVAGGGLGALGALQAAESKQQSDLAEKGLVARMHYGEEARRSAQDAKTRALQMTLDAKHRENESAHTYGLLKAAMAANAKGHINAPSVDPKVLDLWARARLGKIGRAHF